MRRLFTATRAYAFAAALCLTFAASSAAAPQWRKVDLHAHSVFSGDAGIDLGIVKERAKAVGLNAVFLSDHAKGSKFAINNVNPSDLPLDDTLATKWWSWLQTGAPAASSQPNQTDGVLKNTGTVSWPVSVTASAAAPAEVMYMGLRGPNLRSGTVTFSGAIWIDAAITGAGSGVYLSVAFGGDPPLGGNPFIEGYTTAADGVARVGKSFVLVWQCGNAPRGNLDTANVDVRVAGTLSCAPGQWNPFSINLTDAVETWVPAADMPLDVNAFRDIRLTVRAAPGQTTAAHFDTIHVKASAPNSAAAEFTYRNSLLPSFTDPDFVLLPAAEIGISEHITLPRFLSPQQALQDTQLGKDAIPSAPSLGSPAVLAHPGRPGGVDAAPAIQNNAYGADMIEAKSFASTPIWDALHEKDVNLVGVWGSESHFGHAFAVRANQVWTESLSAADLLRNVFEGRIVGAGTNFAGNGTISAPPLPGEPWPARYPIYVSPAITSMPVTFGATGGMGAGWRVIWCAGTGGAAGGSQLANEAPAANGGYGATKQVPIGAKLGWARVDLYESTPPTGTCDPAEPGDQRRLGTNAILFRRMAGLPPGMTVGVERVVTSDGAYTAARVKGLTGGSMSGQTLDVTLDNPAGSIADLGALIGQSTISSVTVGATVIPLAPSAAAFEAATTSTYLVQDGKLRVRVAHTGGPVHVIVAFGQVIAPQPPPPPPVLTGLRATTGPNGRATIEFAVGPVGAGASWDVSLVRAGVVRVRRSGTVGAGGPTPVLVSFTKLAPGPIDLRVDVTADGRTERATTSARISSRKPKFLKKPRVTGKKIPGRVASCALGKVLGWPKPRATFAWLVDGRLVARARRSRLRIPTGAHTIACIVTLKNSRGKARSRSLPARIAS